MIDLKHIDHLLGSHSNVFVNADYLIYIMTPKEWWTPSPDFRPKSIVFATIYSFWFRIEILLIATQQIKCYLLIRYNCVFAQTMCGVMIDKYG